MQQQHHTPHLHPTLRLHHTLRSYTKLATTPPPLQQHNTTNGTLRQTSTVWSHSPRDGWRRGVAAARFPAKTPARTAAAKAHHLPVFPKRGEISRRNARVDHSNKCSSSSACFRSEERQGGGVACPPDWRTRMQRAQKRAGRSAGRTCGESARREQSGV